MHCSLCLELRRMTEDEAESLAFDLLRDVITLARNGQAYKAKLEELRVALRAAPKIARVIGQCHAAMVIDILTER